jgi:urease accessory protein
MICRFSSKRRRKSPSAGPEGPGNAGVDLQQAGSARLTLEPQRGRHDSQLLPLRSAVISVLFIVCRQQVAAHTGEGINTGFASGFWHPILRLGPRGRDGRRGFWGAFLGAPAIWILPVVFPLVMALGGALGVAGVPIPMIETGIALSGVVLGLLIAFAVKAPIWVAAVIVGIFAIFHGHAHGTELPEAFSPYGYAVGFVIGTGLLHLVGIGLGVLTRSEMGRYAVRGAGGVIALVGAAFLFGLA